jgi:hypothetical protein
MADDPAPATVGNLSIGYNYTVLTKYTVTPGLVSGTFNNLSLPGFYGPFPPVTLLWGVGNVLLWGGVLQW